MYIRRCSLFHKKKQSLSSYFNIVVSKNYSFIFIFFSLPYHKSCKWYSIFWIFKVFCLWPQCFRAVWSRLFFSPGSSYFLESSFHVLLPLVSQHSAFIICLLLLSVSLIHGMYSVSLSNWFKTANFTTLQSLTNNR